MDDKKFRAYILVINNWTDYDLKLFTTLKSVEYGIVGKEHSKKGTPHLQCYVRFKNQVDYKRMKKLWPRAHIQPARGDDVHNNIYSSKECVAWEVGTPKKNRPGKRNDIHNAKEIVKKTGKIRDVIETTDNVQAVRMCELYLNYFEQKRNWKPYVRWYYGSTGAGKSKQAYEDFNNDVYTCAKTSKWFQGYDAHENVLIDDFRKDFITFSDLLKLLDRYPYTIEYKGGSRQFLAKNITITCPYHPKDVYNTREDIQQLLRRIDEIKLFGNDPKAIENDTESGYDSDTESEDLNLF